MQEPSSISKRINAFRVPWKLQVLNYLRQTRLRTHHKDVIRDATEQMEAPQFLAFLNENSINLNRTVQNELRRIVESDMTGGGRNTRPRRFDISPVAFDTSPVAFNISPNPRIATRRRALTPQQLQLVVMPYTPDNPTVPRPGSIPKGHRFRTAVNEEEMEEFERIAEEAGLQDMEPYTTRDRDELVEAARQAVAEISEEGRLHDQTGPNKENIESNFTEAIEKMKEIIPQWKEKMQRKAVIEVLGKVLLR